MAQITIGEKIGAKDMNSVTVGYLLVSVMAVNSIYPMAGKSPKR